LSPGPLLAVAKAISRFDASLSALQRSIQASRNWRLTRRLIGARLDFAVRSSGSIFNTTRRSARPRLQEFACSSSRSTRPVRVLGRRPSSKSSALSVRSICEPMATPLTLDCVPESCQATPGACPETQTTRPEAARVVSLALLDSCQACSHCSENVLAATARCPWRTLCLPAFDFGQGSPYNVSSFLLLRWAWIHIPRRPTTVSSGLLPLIPLASSLL
jgi:hypothetical protein